MFRRQISSPRPRLGPADGHLGPHVVPFAENARGALARTCRELAGLTGANVHRARHTFAMRWIGDRGSHAAVQAVLGQQDLRATQRYARGYGQPRAPSLGHGRARKRESRGGASTISAGRPCAAWSGRACRARSP